MSSTAAGSPRPHRLTVEDYYRMGEVGILRPDERVELIDGEIIDMAPIGTLHAGTVDQLAGILQRAVNTQGIIRTQSPVLLDDYTEPEPDITLLRPRGDFYKSAHPRAEDILLIIEVADTSLRYDRDVKVPLYARHGVPEVWLIDVNIRRLARYRDPQEGEFRQTDRPEVGAPIAVGTLQGLWLDLTDIFAI